MSQLFSDLLFGGDPMPPVIDPVIDSICKALHRSPEAFKEFTRIKWDVVENRCSPFMRSLADVLESTLQLKCNLQDCRKVVAKYTNRRAKFQHKLFIKDVIDAMRRTAADTFVAVGQNSEELEPQVDSDRTPAVSVQKIVKEFGIYNNMSSTGYAVRPKSLGRARSPAANEQIVSTAVNRDIVVEKLLQAIDSQTPLRLHINVDTFNMIPDMTERDFGREIKRVFGLSLSKQETHLLFDLFDFNGTGVVSEAQLHEGLAKLHINRGRKQRQEKHPPRLQHSLGTTSFDLSDDEGPSRSPKGSSKPQNDTDHLPSNASVFTSNTKASYAMSQYSYSAHDFQSAILKLSGRYMKTDPRLNPPLLHVSDGYLSVQFIRRAIREQLGVKLSKAETNALCSKLSYVSTDSRVSLIEDEMDNPKFLFVGKAIKALIVRISNTVVKKLPKLQHQQHCLTNMSEANQNRSIVHSEGSVQLLEPELLTHSTLSLTETTLREDATG